MPGAAAVATPPATGKAGGGKKASMPMVPFTRAAKRHVEPFQDFSQIISANTVALGPFDIPAYGYMRNIIILAQATGGSSNVTVTTAEDSPWIAIQDLQLSDVNGAPIWGPCSGYDLYLHNKYGGYEFSTEPKLNPSFAALATGASASGNFAFSLKIPVEINLRDSLGSLANQNASSTYKIKLTQNSTTGIYGATPPNLVLPTIRWRMFLEAWSQPPNQDLKGREQLTVPPAHGTTQYLSKYTANIASGAQTVRWARVGNYIRMVIFVDRRSGSTRANGEADFPDPTQIFWDTRLLHNSTKTIWRDSVKYCYGYTAALEAANGPDNGVFPYQWADEFDGKVGHELRDGWLPTLQSTRLELQGSFASATALDLITNDVAPSGEIFV